MKNSYSYYGRSFISHTVFTKVFCLLQLFCKLWLIGPSSINFWGTLSQMYVFFVFLNFMNLAPHLYSFLQIGNGDALGLLLSCVFRVASGTWRKISATFPGLFPDVLVIFQEKWQQKFEKRLFTKPQILTEEECLLLLQKLKNLLTMFYIAELFFRIKPSDAT